MAPSIDYANLSRTARSAKVREWQTALKLESQV